MEVELLRRGCYSIEDLFGPGAVHVVELWKAIQPRKDLCLRNLGVDVTCVAFKLQCPISLCRLSSPVGFDKCGCPSVNPNSVDYGLGEAVCPICGNKDSGQLYVDYFLDSQVIPAADTLLSRTNRDRNISSVKLECVLATHSEVRVSRADPQYSSEWCLYDRGYLAGVKQRPVAWRVLVEPLPPVTSLD